MRRLIVGLAVVLFVGVAVSNAVAAVQFTVTDLGTLGGTYGSANDINNMGQIVGFSTLVAGNSSGHATLWSGGSITDLGTLGGTYSNASAINNAGQIVGASTATGSGSGRPRHVSHPE